MMTKSLHTVTAVANVARHLIANAHSRNSGQICAAALTLLGYEHTAATLAVAIESGDTTLAACLAGVKKELSK